jgi:hypothetical protein
MGGRCDGTSDPQELARLGAGTDSVVRAMRRAPEPRQPALRTHLQLLMDRAALVDVCTRPASATDLRALAELATKARSLGVPTLEHAYNWSRRAVLADSADRRNWRAMAHAWDHLQVAKQQPQWFATVVTCSGPAEGKCALAPIDTTKVSDPQRVELGLRTLVQQRGIIDSTNRARARP